MDLYNFRNIILIFLALIYICYNSLINKKYFYVFFIYLVLALYINFTNYRFLCFFAILCLSVYHLYLDSKLYKGGRYTTDYDLVKLLNGGKNNKKIKKTKNNNKNTNYTKKNTKKNRTNIVRAAVMDIKKKKQTKTKNRRHSC